MAAEVLETCVAICKFFYEQRELNDEAKGVLADLTDYVKRLLSPLQSLDTRGLEIASEQLRHLWECLRNSQRIYEKYKDGWKFDKWWVTPAKILAKAKTQEEKMRHAWHDLSTTLAIANHNHNNMQPSTAPAAAETKTDDTWELPASAVNIDLNILGDPKEPLGKGSFSVVGLGTFSVGGGTVLSVAVKMALANRRADAARDPQIVKNFRRGVSLLCTIEHPNIVECHGGITYMNGGDPCMWIIMEKLDMTLSAAITEKHLQLGRDDPRTYVELVVGIFNALTYLHTPVDGNPIVHRDLKPENIMINKDRVVKLIDFDMSKVTVSGEGSSFTIKGTREYMAPEIQGGGCSVAADVWAAALVALFIWWGLTPNQTPDREKIEKSADPKANFTQQLMLQCLNENPKKRHAAAVVSFELDGFVIPPERPSFLPGGCMIFLEHIDIKDQEEQKKLLDAGIRLKDDLLDLEMEDLADVFKDLALSTRKRLKRFVELPREEKEHVLAGDLVASSSPAAASSSTTTSSSPPPPSKPSVLILAPAHSLQAAESNGSGGFSHLQARHVDADTRHQATLMQHHMQQANTQVELHSLQAAEINGKRGRHKFSKVHFYGALIVRMYLDTDFAEFVDTSRLVLFDTEAGRWKVEMNTGDFLKLKPVNLHLVEVMAVEAGGGVVATPPRPDDGETALRGTPPALQRRVCFDEANLEANLRDVEVTVDGRDKELLLQGMEGIKVMVKEVEKLCIPEDDFQLYAFVHIGNCESRTRSAKNDAANKKVVCKKMSSPSCSGSRWSLT